MVDQWSVPVPLLFGKKLHCYPDLKIVCELKSNSLCGAGATMVFFELKRYWGCIRSVWWVFDKHSLINDDTRFSFQTRFVYTCYRFCTKHGKKHQITSKPVPPEMTNVAKIVIPKLITRFVYYLRNKHQGIHLFTLAACTLTSFLFSKPIWWVLM